MSVSDIKSGINTTEGQKPLLYDELTTPDRVSLANLVLQPGWSILIRMMESACTVSTQKVIKLDPEIADYDRKLAALQQMARSTNAFSARLLSSVDFHTQRGIAEQQEADAKSELDVLLSGLE